MGRPQGVMFMPGNNSEFERFRLKLTAWARSQLEMDNRPYMETFTAMLSETGGDFNKVSEETRSLLKGPRTWRKLLTALLDVEQTIDKVRRSVWFIGRIPQPADSNISDPGAWLVYHVDAWHIHTYGLLDRMKRIITLTCRHVVRPRENADELKARLLDDVEKMKAVVSRTRHSVAHGGGSVEALEEDDLWEPYVMIGPDAWLNITSSYYEGVALRQTKWHDGFKRSSVQVLAMSEAWFGELANAFD